MPLPTLPESVFQNWHEQLREWSADGSLASAARHALELEGEQPLLDELVVQWAEGDFSDLPPITLLPASSMPGAAGAHAISTGTIYLNQDWLETASDQRVIAVLTEELGHHLDGLLNAVDTPGDEGNRFSASLLPTQIGSQPAPTEHDFGVIAINGVKIDVEFATVKLPFIFSTDRRQGFAGRADIRHSGLGRMSDNRISAGILGWNSKGNVYTSANGQVYIDNKGDVNLVSLLKIDGLGNPRYNNLIDFLAYEQAPSVPSRRFAHKVAAASPGLNPLWRSS